MPIKPILTHNFYGHQNVIHYLTQTFQSRLPHALLFQGLKGTGKATCAYHLAHAVLTQSINSLTTINKDDALYNRLKAHGHSDVLIIEKSEDESGKFSKDITISHARRILKFLSKTALEGGWRIIIIDSVDEMNRQALNAILKGLEEPPPQCLFILINHQSGRLLPTITSRCQRLVFSPLTSVDLQNIMATWQDKQTLTPTMLSTIYDFAEGSVNRAQHFLRFNGEQILKALHDVINDLNQNLWSKCFNFIKESLVETKNNDFDKFIFVNDILNFYLKKIINNLIFVHSKTDYKINETTHTLNYWVGLWNYNQKLFHDTITLSLDPFQALITIFTLFTPNAEIPHQCD